MSRPTWHLLAALLPWILAPPVRAAVPPDLPQAGFRSQVLPGGVAVGIWYPATGTPVAQRLGPYEQAVVPDAPLPTTPRPLVVFSHGTGGSYAGHYDTAIALARAGFVVAALTHPGDNWRDRSRATDLQARPVALSALIDTMLTGWAGHAAVDPRRIGAFGFSAGGFTVLAAAGGRPDLSRVGPYCAARPALFECALLKAHPVAPAPWRDTRDPRLRAIVVAAPALGYAFGRDGLAAVTLPVQLWRADQDAVLPPPDHADAVRAALPHPPEFHPVAAAGHYDFLAPCAPAPQPLAICASAPGFDRAAFHAAFDAAVVGFFRRHL